MKDLKKYVIKIEKFIPPKLCDQAVQGLSQLNTWWQHEYYSTDGKLTPIKRSGKNELWCTDWLESPINKQLENVTMDGALQYINYLKIPWFSNLEALTQLKYNRYASKQKMQMHCDHIKQIFDGTIKGVPIISLIGNLNEDYKGGEFVMWGDTEIKLKKGDMLIFPSNFLYPHKVNPVKKGKRYSFVSWGF